MDMSWTRTAASLQMYRFLAILFLALAQCHALNWRNLAENAMSLVKAAPHVKDPALCGICTVALDGAKKLLNDTQTQKIIINDALQVCSSLPSDIQTGCNDLVTTYEPIITDYIVSSSSSAVCLLIGACIAPTAIAPSDLTGKKVKVGLKQSEESRLFARLRKTIVASSKARSSSAATDYCDQCKMVVLEAHSLITNPTVQSSILNYTKQVCDLAGPTVGPTCDQLADMYVPVFFDLLEKAFNSPDEICAMIGLCKPKMSSHTSIRSGATEKKRQRQ